MDGTPEVAVLAAEARGKESCGSEEEALEAHHALRAACEGGQGKEAFDALVEQGMWDGATALARTAEEAHRLGGRPIGETEWRVRRETLDVARRSRPR